MRRDRFLLGFGLIALLAGCHGRTMTMTPPPSDPHPPAQTKEQKAQSAADVHTRLAQHYIAIGNMEGALDKVKIAVKEDPTFVPAQTVMAYIYEGINDMPNAEIHYREAQKLQPDKGDTNNNLGQFLCHVGKVQESLPYFAKAITDPFYQTPDVALTNQGGCQLQIGDRAGAEASLRQAVQRNPNNPNALLLLAHVLYLNQNDFGAKAFLQRFEALGHPNADALKLGHDIESRLGNMDAAQNYNKRLVSQFPDSEQAHALNQSARP